MSRPFLALLVISVIFSSARRASTVTPTRRQTPEVDLPDDNTKDGARNNSRCECGRKLTREIKTLRRELRELKEKFNKADLEVKGFISTFQQDRCPRATCPMGSVRHDSLCLLYVLHKRRTWRSARDYCRRYGGNLVTLDSKSVTKQIRSFLDDNIGRNTRRKLDFWTSLILTTPNIAEPAYVEPSVGSGRADGFYWASFNTTKPLAFKNWRVEPSSADDPLPPSCVVTMGGRGFQWEPRWCTQENHFVCEFHLTSPSKQCQKRRRKMCEGHRTECENT